MKNSHQHNDLYMEEFNAALRDMGVGHSHSYAAEVSTCQISESVAFEGAVSSSTLNEEKTPIVQQWLRGPHNPEGNLLDFSPRNLLCLSISQGLDSEVAVGGADHSVHTFNLETGRKDRSLHSKIHGHADWISSVAHTSPDTGSRVLSGGGDGKVCLWNKKGVACEDLNPRHDGPVSVIKCDGSAPIAVSGSYDKSLRIWGLPQVAQSNSHRSSRRDSTGPSRKRPRELATIRSHGAPVLCLTWSRDGVMLSGDRDGMLNFHDIRSAQQIRTVKHGVGHVTCVAHNSSGTSDPLAGSDVKTNGSHSVFFSGGQDGCVRVYDIRQEQCVANLKLHASKQGVGALVDIIPARGDVLVSAGADNRICVLELRKFTRRAVFHEQREFIYSLAVWSDMVLSGGGDGMILAHNLASQGEGPGVGLLWGLGASSGRSPSAMCCPREDGGSL